MKSKRPLTEEEKRERVLLRLRGLVWQSESYGDNYTPKPYCIFCGPDWGERHAPDCEFLLIHPDAPVREKR